MSEDCLNARVRAMSPAAALGAGLYSAAATSTSSVSTSAAAAAAGAGLAAATELARLGDRAAAAAAATAGVEPSLAPWSLPPPPPFTAAVDTPSEKLGRLDRTATDERNNFDDCVNKHRCVGL